MTHADNIIACITSNYMLFSLWYGQHFFIYLAPDNSADLRHVITGLAVSYAVDDREVALYFGCAAQVDLGGVGGQQIGGAGVVRLPAYGVWPARITPLRFSPADSVHAGAMFVVDRCAGYSNWNADEVNASGTPEVVGRRRMATLPGIAMLIVSFWICRQS